AIVACGLATNPHFLAALDARLRPESATLRPRPYAGGKDGSRAAAETACLSAKGFRIEGRASSRRSRGRHHFGHRRKAARHERRRLSQTRPEQLSGGR